jgi:hypothetical protein
MRTNWRRLIAVALLVGLAAPGFAAAPAPAAPAKGDDPLATARKVLDEVGDMTYEARSLNDVIADLKERVKIAILLDPAVFQIGLNPNLPNVSVTQKQVKFRDGLKAVLAPYNLRFGLVKEGLFISTEEGLVVRQLRQRVQVDCDGTPFATAAKQLAADTGANLVIDPRLKEKATAAVTLKLEDVPLETAVRLLAEVADLRAVRMNNVLFVTTPERAEKLRPDADGPVPAPGPNNAFFPGLNPQPLPGIGGLAVPLQVVPAPAAAPPPPPAEKR